MVWNCSGTVRTVHNEYESLLEDHPTSMLTKWLLSPPTPLIPLISRLSPLVPVDDMKIQLFPNHWSDDHSCDVLKKLKQGIPWPGMVTWLRGKSQRFSWFPVKLETNWASKLVNQRVTCLTNCGMELMIVATVFRPLIWCDNTLNRGFAARFSQWECVSNGVQYHSGCWVVLDYPLLCILPRLHV